MGEEATSIELSRKSFGHLRLAPDKRYDSISTNVRPSSNGRFNNLMDRPKRKGNIATKWVRRS